MNPNVDISELLKKRRYRANMTQIEAANRSKITKACYGSYEEGRALPDLFTLMRIAKSFGYNSLDRFLAGGKKGNNNLPIVRAYYNASEEERKIVDRILNIS